MSPKRHTLLKQHRVLILLLCSQLIATLALASDGPLPLTKATNILSEWKESQHLYTKGDLGIASEQLHELEHWLDEHAPNWTVILLKNAQGERYKDARGEEYFGMEAVEHALGKGLPAQTRFGQLIHSSTEQANGAFYILFLDERKFSYFGSDLYERRGLGANNWIGQLDGPAKKAMRNGQRITDSAKNTVRHIDEKLAQTLAKEIRHRQQNEYRVEQRKEIVEEQIIEARVTINNLTSRIETFKNNSDHPEWSNGDVAQSDLSSLTADLRGAHRAWGQGHTAASEKLVQEIQQKTSFFLDEIANFHLDIPTISTLEQEISAIKVHRWNLGGDQLLGETRLLVNQARSQHTRGNRRYRHHLLHAQEKLATVIEQNEVASAEFAADASLKMKRRRDVSRVSTVGGGAGLLLLGGLATRANRRRRPHRHRAQELLASRQGEMAATNDRFLRLTDRTNLIVGTADALPERGYTGLTLQKSEEALHHTDRAFILSSKVSEHITNGEHLIYPRSPFGKFRNAFSSTRYHRAIHLLDRQFTIKQPSLNPEKSDSKNPDETPQADEHRIELPQWKQRMDDTMTEAETTLEEIDQAWATIIPRAEALQEKIQTLQDQETSHAQLCGILTSRKKSATYGQGHLHTSELFTTTLPHLQAILEDGLTLGKGDPLAALLESAETEGAKVGPIPQAERLVQEATILLDQVTTFRQERWTDMEKAAEELHTQGRQTNWIDQQLTHLSETQNTLAEKATHHRIATELETQDQALNKLADQVLHASALLLRAEEEIAPTIARQQEKIKTTKVLLSKSLKLDSLNENNILNETPHLIPGHPQQLSPATHLSTASQQQLAALAALDRGDTSAAQHSLDEANSHTEHANSLISQTIEASENYHTTRQALLTTREELQTQFDLSKKTISQLTATYHRKALQCGEDNDNATPQKESSEKDQPLPKNPTGKKPQEDTPDAPDSSESLQEISNFNELDADFDLFQGFANSEETEKKIANNASSASSSLRTALGQHQNGKLSPAPLTSASAVIDHSLTLPNNFADSPHHLTRLLEIIQDHLDEAATRHQSGHLLTASQLLHNGLLLVDQGLDLTAAIEERQDELTQLHRKNKTLLNEATRRNDDLSTAAENPRITQETLLQVAQTGAHIEEATNAIKPPKSDPDETKGDLLNPYHGQELLLTLTQKLDATEDLLNQDHLSHRQALELLDIVENAHQRALSLVRRSEKDQIPDSPTVTQCNDDITANGQQLETLRTDLALKENPHGDWPDIHQELRQIHHQLSQTATVLREELQKAQEALDNIQRAGKAIDQATTWRGQYGVRISGHLGLSALNHANVALQTGDYTDALRQAGLARTLARQAIARAQSEEASRIRAAQAAASAAARRRRHSSSTFGNGNSSIGSSFGGSRSGGSSFGGGSSFSSGSGVSRSGW